MNKVNIKINGINIQVPEEYTVLEASKQLGINIPTLCYLKDINEIGACRMCLVEIKGVKSLQASCIYPVSEGLEVYTNTEKVRKARKANLELILSNHDRKCTTCIRSENCELQKLAKDLNINDIEFEGENTNYQIDDFSESIVRDNNKCILCRRCVSVCKNIQSTSVIDVKNRGFNTEVGVPFNKSLKESSCIMCGQCINVCPVGALREKDHIERVWKALNDKNKYVVVQTAPAVRVALGEEFGLPIGTKVKGKMVTALKLMGFEKVFDTNTGADLTIIEEGNELIERINNNGVLPMITSCSPGWIKFCEHNYHEFIPNISSCKSPHMMLGAIIKSYYAKEFFIEPEDIYVVSVMPCTAKKYEISRPEMESDGIRDVDAVITTRELARMIKESGIDFLNLKDSVFDEPFGEASGAAAIFGATGGVMEAALRTVAEKIEGKKLDDVEFKEVRGQEGIKEFSIKLSNIELKGAVVNGMLNARKILDKIKTEETNYSFIEIMGCPGGCVTGGGQPIVNSKTQFDVNVFEKRANAIYEEDREMDIRLSHENEFIKKLYDEYLMKPNSHKSHKLLHTSYTQRQLYSDDFDKKTDIN